MQHSSSAQLGQAIFLAVIALALWKGYRTERIVASTLLVQLVLSSLLNHPYRLRPEYGLLALDVMSLAVFAALAFATDRRWTLFAAAFQLLAILTHLGKMLDPTLDRWAYLTTAILWSYAVLGSLAIATIQVWIDRTVALRQADAGSPALSRR